MLYPIWGQRGTTRSQKGELGIGDCRTYGMGVTALGIVSDSGVRCVIASIELY